MTRRLVRSRFPDLPIELHIRQHVVGFDALIDTGFDGDIIIPHDALGGEQADVYLLYRLTDGSVAVGDGFVGSVILGSLGENPIVAVALGTECLIGRRITDHLRLKLDHGRQVIAEP